MVKAIKSWCKQIT